MSIFLSSISLKFILILSSFKYLCLMRWAGHVARMGEDRGVHRVLVGKSEGKIPYGETKT
jgi:hypothetical protein